MLDALLEPAPSWLRAQISCTQSQRGPGVRDGVKSPVSQHMIHARKWKKVRVVQSCPTLCGPMDYIVHGILQARILEWVAVPFSRGSSQPRDQTQVSRIAGGFFTSWATRKAQEYWSGSLSLLQQIFQTQKSNWGLLHCRWILYQLGYREAQYVPGAVPNAHHTWAHISPYESPPML